MGLVGTARSFINSTALMISARVKRIAKELVETYLDIYDVWKTLERRQGKNAHKPLNKKSTSNVRKIVLSCLEPKSAGIKSIQQYTTSVRKK